MSEIQSAEELALKIERISQMRCENPDCEVCAEHKKEAADLIRARDKAIIARIRKYLQGMRAEGEHDLRQAIHYCDDVLRELGGEQ